jgi:hypothetical protein
MQFALCELLGWTLEELRALEVEEYEELVAWALERSKGKDDDSIDADEVVRQLDEKKRREAASNGDV